MDSWIETSTAQPSLTFCKMLKTDCCCNAALWMPPAHAPPPPKKSTPFFPNKKEKKKKLVVKMRESRTCMIIFELQAQINSN